MKRFVSCAAVLLSFVAAVVQAAEPSTVVRVYVGTYTDAKKSKGIYFFDFDTAAGSGGPVTLAAEVKNPSFLAFHPDKKHLYAVGEIADFNGKKAGGVHAFAIREDGTLKALNSQTSGGGGPCHVSVDAEGKFVGVANYGGGSVEILPISADKSLAEPSCFIQHSGKDADGKPLKPHAHAIHFDATGGFVFAPDLGLDQIVAYKLDREIGKLSPNSPPFTELPKGAGPRHFAFHPSKKFAFVINETSSRLTSLRYDAAGGVLTLIDTLSTLPADFKGGNSTAEVQVHPNGKWVYGSNRGHNSIASFAVDEATGKLTHTGNLCDGVKIPRNFGIDPTGKFMLVANQDGDDIVVFAINPTDGTLSATGKRIEAPKPVCVKFLVR